MSKPITIYTIYNTSDPKKYYLGYEDTPNFSKSNYFMMGYGAKTRLGRHMRRDGIEHYRLDILETFEGTSADTFARMKKYHKLTLHHKTLNEVHDHMKSHLKNDDCGITDDDKIDIMTNINKILWFSG